LLLLCLDFFYGESVEKWLKRNQLLPQRNKIVT
jgi:hypothetical protein